MKDRPRATMILFNRSNIYEACFIGFQNPEGLYFRKETLGKPDDFPVAEREIVSRKQADA